MTMEEIGQSYGYILYTTHLDASQSGKLVLNGLHDYASVYLDRKLVGVLDRRLDQASIDIPAASTGRELAILVENTGRINYNVVLRNESKGILNDAMLANKELAGWSIFSLPMDRLDKLHYRRSSCTGPCFFRAALIAPSVVQDTFLDTFLDTTPIRKGFVWINDVPLGRAWNAGPQASLFLPGSWLKKGQNSLVIFDLQANSLPALQTINHALWIPGTDEAAKK
jgi:beta-galactosidase